MAISLFASDNAVLSGRVLNENGAAVAGLDLDFYRTSSGGGLTPPIPSLDPPDGITSTNVVTAEDGSFQVEVMAGAYQIRLLWPESKGIYPAVRTVTLIAGQPISNYVFRVQTTSVEIFGKVTGADQAPLSDVYVRFHPTDNPYGGGQVPESRTDAEGNYRLRVFPGEWSGAPVYYSLNQLGYLAVPATNVTFLAPATNEINFTATRPTITLSGILRDQNGEAIKGLAMYATQNNPYNSFSTISSEVDGSFSFKVTAGAWQVGAHGLMAGQNDKYLSLSYPVEVSDPGLVTNIVIPTFTSRLDGVLQTESGEPITNISFTMTSTFNGVQVHRWATTDVDGAFRAPLVNGRWSVVASSYSLNQMGFLSPDGIALILNDSTNNVTFVAKTPPSLLRGVIRDESGAGVSNVTVRVNSIGPIGAGDNFIATSGAQGNYSVRLSPGQWYFEFDQASLKRRGVVETHELPVEILPDAATTIRDLHVVNTPHQIKVIVRDAQGAAIDDYGHGPGGSLRLRASGQLQGDWRQFLSSFVGDTAELNLPEGEWTISIQLPGDFRPISSRTLQITNDLELEFVAQKWIINSAVYGEIIDDEGRPMSNVSVNAYPRSSSQTKTTGVDGKFSFDVAPGWCAIAATIPGYLVPAVSAEVLPNTNIFRLIRARKTTSTLNIDFNLPNGHEDEFSIIARTRVGGGVYSTGIMSENSAAALELFEGEWLISIHARHRSVRAIARRTITIDETVQQLTLDMVSAAQTAKISGKIVDEGGPFMTTMTVSAGTPLNDYKDGVINADGTFEVGAFGGEWGVAVWLPDNSGSSTSATIYKLQVTDGEDLDVGTIVFPKRTATPVIQLRTPEGGAIEFEGPFYFYAKRTVGAFQFTASMNTFSGDLSLPLTPGEWEFSFANNELNNLGFANVQPITFTIPEGASTNTIVLQRAPLALPSPRFSVTKDAAGQPRLRLHLDKVRSADIEVSSDLQNWKLYSDEYISVGYVDLPTSPTNQVQFFRAIGLDF